MRMQSWAFNVDLISATLPRAVAAGHVIRRCSLVTLALMALRACHHLDAGRLIWFGFEQSRKADICQLQNDLDSAVQKEQLTSLKSG